jgi:CheY-like chemotaxis protein
MERVVLIERIRGDAALHDLPIIVHEPGDLQGEEEAALFRPGGGAPVRRARTLERLLYETVMVLHQAEAHLPKAKRRAMERARGEEHGLSERKVLIIDDDVRNIFALTAILERHRMHVLHAENGRDGIALLKQTPDLDLVLMDIMMPEMDGYETIREIRRMGKFGSLPIVTLTAKAMKGDREKCIQAGASDYIAKPVDPDHLLSVLRVWLDRSRVGNP